LERAVSLPTSAVPVSASAGRRLFSAMEGFGSGVANPGGAGRYAHINSAVRSRNAALGLGLALFVGGVYSYTYSKMAANELNTLASELDEVRAARAERGVGAGAAAGPASAAAQAAGKAAPAR